MTVVSIAEAQAKLPELIHALTPGEALIITEHDEPVAKLVSEAPAERTKLRPPPGLGKGLITVNFDDEEHLKDFADYMP